MSDIKFGGPIGEFFDPSSKLTFHPRCLGEATFPFEANEEFATAARACFVRHVAGQVGQRLQNGTAMFSVITVGALDAAILASVSAELRTPFTLSMLQVNLLEEEVVAFKSVLKVAAMAKMEAMSAQLAANAAPPAPAAPVPHNCSHCGAPGTGKFCASCGSPL